MFFKKPLPPAPPSAHFRQFVQAKESWEKSVWHRLEFRPKTTDISSRHRSIVFTTEAAFASANLLLAVELFDILKSADQRIITIASEEKVLLECLAFSSSAVCNLVNKKSDEYCMLIDVRGNLVESFNFMCLLDCDEIDDIALSRFDLYDKAYLSTNKEAYLCDIYARILTYLADGENNSNINIRYEDPASLIYRMVAHEFLTFAVGKLKKMFKMIVERNIEEDRSF